MSAPEQRWVLVPREPSVAIKEAVEFAIYRYGDVTSRDSERAMPYVYAAAMAAAPKPSEGDLGKLVNSLMFEMERRGWPTFGTAPPGLVRDALRAALDALGA